MAERMRDAQGRFVKGHENVSPGRPKRDIEEAYLHAIKEAMPTKRWLECLQVYAARAEAGDRYALRFFADYLLGRPVERRELTGLGGQPLQINVHYDRDRPTPTGTT